MPIEEPVRSGEPHGNPVDPLPPARRPESRIFEGRYVTARPLDYRRDAESLYEASHQDLPNNTIWNYLPYGPFTAAAFVSHLRGFSASADPYFYVFTPVGEEHATGMASLMTIEPLHGSIEIGHIMLGAPLQKTPAATEAIFLLMRHAMDDLGNRRIEWKCDATNAPSRGAARRYGFTYEGTFAQHRIVKGRNRDTAWYSIIDSEWPAIRACFESWLNPSNFDAAGRQRAALSEMTGQLRIHRSFE